MKIRILLSSILILFSAITYAEDPKAEAQIQFQEALIGDQVELKLSTQSDTSLIPIFPVIQDSISGLEILKIGKIDTIFKEGVLSLDQKLILSSYDTGVYNIPPLTFAFERANVGMGNFITKNTNPLQIKFKGLDIDSTSAEKDIKPVMDAEFILAEIIEYIYVAIVLILLIILGIYIYKKYFKKEKIEEEELPFDPKIPADIIAIESLNSLKEKKLWQESHFKRYYSELTDILRIYIHRVYQIETLERTSDEILSSLSSKMDEDILVLLKEILETADLVKFAKEKPIGNVNDQMLENAYLIVNKTKHLIKDENSEDQDV